MSRRTALKLIGGFAATLAGCRATGAASPRPPLVALVMKSLANEFFVTMAAGARRDQAAHAGQYRLLANGIANESDLAEQVAIVD